MQTPNNQSTHHPTLTQYNYFEHIKRLGENGAHWLSVSDILNITRLYETSVEAAACAMGWEDHYERWRVGLQSPPPALPFYLYVKAAEYQVMLYRSKPTHE